MINWFNILYSINHYSSMICYKSVNVNYMTVYSLLKINNESLLFTLFRNSNSPDMQIMFFTYDIHRKIHDYSITLSAFSKCDILYLIYATDNHPLYNIFNKTMCKHLIYYIYLEINKAQQLTNEALEDLYK